MTTRTIDPDQVKRPVDESGTADERGNRIRRRDPELADQRRTDDEARKLPRRVPPAAVTATLPDP